MTDVQSRGCICGSGACVVHEDSDGAVVVTCECGTELGSWHEFMNRPRRPSRTGHAVELQSTVSGWRVRPQDRKKRAGQSGI